MCEAPAFHHGPRPLVADIQARASVIPRRIRLPARVCERREKYSCFPSPISRFLATEQSKKRLTICAGIRVLARTDIESSVEQALGRLGHQLAFRTLSAQRQLSNAKSLVEPRLSGRLHINSQFLVAGAGFEPATFGL